MQNSIKKEERLPKHIQELLETDFASGGQYLLFSNGDCFHIQGAYSPDQKRILYGLQREYSELGVSLVDAIWFSHPMKILLVSEQDVYWSEADVYKCHIAGPLFMENLLRIREQDPRGDIASSWELRAGVWKKADARCFLEEIQKALTELDGSFMEEVHLDLKLLK